jgi:hypothetical protein
MLVLDLFPCKYTWIGLKAYSMLIENPLPDNTKIMTN